MFIVGGQFRESSEDAVQLGDASLCRVPLLTASGFRSEDTGEEGKRLTSLKRDFYCLQQGSGSLCDSPPGFFIAAGGGELQNVGHFSLTGY